MENGLHVADLGHDLICSDCRFFIETGGWLSGMTMAYANGECHFYAPCGKWPYVHGGCWCNDFAKKEEAPCQT